MTLSFGSVLRQAREVRRLSAVETARTAGISSAYLNKLENNAVKKPSPQVLHQLAVVLAVPYAELMGLVGYQVPGVEQPTDAARLTAALFADLTSSPRGSRPRRSSMPSARSRFLSDRGICWADPGTV
jgi:transcriptional regulator with XRE-family HTH domain